MSVALRDVAALPRWNLDSLFPGPESPELRAALDQAARDIAHLAALFDERRVGAGGTAGEPSDAAFEEVINRYNAVLELALRLEGYLYCLVAADVRDEAAEAAAGEWRRIKVGLSRLAPRFTAWIGGLAIDALVTRSAVAREHAPALRRVAAAASHLMPPGEEDLAAALGPSSIAAWVKLRDDLAGRATARLEIDGEERDLPLSEAMNLAFHHDRNLRRKAFEAVRETWQGLEIPLAAALNSVKGHQLTLSERRGWDDPLDQAVFANAIDRDVLTALHQATRESIPDFQRYLRAKARLLGLPVLAGYDLYAPVGEPGAWPYEKAREFIIETFSAEHPGLGAMAERAFAESWIDAEPREGKDGGGFSVAVGGDESRIFLNYAPVYELLSTLAHELGHAYQNLVIAEKGRTPLQAPPDDVAAPTAFPMTLAETASTACEVLVHRAVRTGAMPAQEAALIDNWLQSVSGTVFGIYARFLLEREVFARRRERELTPGELNEIMAEAWREVAGDAIDPATISTFDWTKPHYFIDELWYYNFPYAFGMLFAVGLLAQRDADPVRFWQRFDDLLADSGMAEAVDLAAPFGIDLRDPAFWRAGLDTYRADLARFEALVETLSAQQEPVL